MDDIPRTKFYRFLEILPGAASWAIILVPIAMSFWKPRAVAIFITIYVIFWFLRSLKSSVFLVYSFRKSRRFQSMDWGHLLHFFSDQPPSDRKRSDPVASYKLNAAEGRTISRIQELKERSQFKKADEIFHVVIIPTYKEEKEILESTLDALAQVEFPLQRIFVVLATEERDRFRAETNAKWLTERFAGRFGGFFHFMHPANLPNELPAKGANISYAGKKISEVLADRGMQPSNVLVTTLDADNRPHPKYFQILTYHYLFEFNRWERSYQPLAFYYNNIWDVPFSNRLISIANTFWYLAESGESHHLFNASVYAQSLDTLQAIDFWSRQTIVEDIHQYWRTYFHFNGESGVVPLFIPVYQDALQNKTYFTSLTGQYKQLRRWAWCASEIPYIIMKIAREWRRLPIIKSLSRFLYLTCIQLMWATAPIIILFNKSIPTLLNPEFGNSLFAYNLGRVFNIIFTFMLISIFVSLWISLLSLPRPRGRWGAARFFLTILEWIMLPFVTIIYGAIPAIDAQTRLMLGKPISFTVTPKIRR